MTGSIVSVFPFRNRVSSKEAFEGLELGEGKPSRPVLRGPGGRKAVWLLGTNASRLVLINALAVIDADSVVIGHPAVIVEPLAPKKALLKRRPTESQVTIRKAFGL
jgi:hypothetical protein